MFASSELARPVSISLGCFSKTQSSHTNQVCSLEKSFTPKVFFAYLCAFLGHKASAQQCQEVLAKYLNQCDREHTCWQPVERRNTILDYSLEMGPLKKPDQVLDYGELGNFSITGIEITFTRHKLKYLYVYYLPSGLFVVVSWTSFIIPPQVCTNWTAISWQLSVMSCLWKTKAQSNIGKTCNTCNIILSWCQ